MAEDSILRTNSVTSILYGEGEPSPNVEVVTHPRKLHMYQVTEAELGTIQEVGQRFSLEISFFALLFGALITLLITLTTVSISDPKMYSSYVAVTIISALGSLYFGIRAIIDYRNAKKKIKLLVGEAA